MNNNVNIFGSEISSFRNGATNYTYSYNSVGNLFFKSTGSSFNQTFLLIKDMQYAYNDKKISEIYNLNFEEFVDNTNQTAPVDQSETISSLQDTISGLQDLLVQNGADTQTLTDLQSQVDSDKTLIINLRIALGQGTQSSDFSDTYPYNALNPTTSTAQTTVARPAYLTSSLFNSSSLQLQSVTSSVVTSSSVVINPLAIFDTDGNMLLDATEITNMGTAFKNRHPVLLDIIKNAKNPKFTNKKGTALTSAGLQYLVNSFYSYELKNVDAKTILKNLDANGNHIADKDELAAISYQIKSGNPVIMKSFPSDFNAKKKKLVLTSADYDALIKVIFGT